MEKTYKEVDRKKSEKTGETITKNSINSYSVKIGEYEMLFDYDEKRIYKITEEGYKFSMMEGVIRPIGYYSDSD